MNNILNWTKFLRVAGLFAFLLFSVSSASANVYGVRTITGNTTLSDHQYGAVIFGASNITLDCAGKQVHISSHSNVNCGASNNLKCGIVANGRSNITIRNCHVVGGFDYGVWLNNTTNSVIEYSSSNATTGFRFENNTDLSGYSLDANYSALGGYELRGNTDAHISYAWATGCGGDGFDENNGTGTVYDQDGRSIGNGVNGYECDGCTDVMYGSLPVNSVGVTSNYNGQHGISVDNSLNIWVQHSDAWNNTEDGIRFQDVTSAPSSEVQDSSGWGNGVCDARSDSSPGDLWLSLSDFGTLCGSFQD